MSNKSIFFLGIKVIIMQFELKMLTESIWIKSSGLVYVLFRFTG